MSKISIESIKEVFLEKNIQFPLDEFIKAVEQQEKNRKETKKAIEAAMPEIVDVYSEAILPELEEDETVEEVIENAVDSNDYHDMFYDPDGLDDYGADDIAYFKVGDKFYEVELHCEANWVGDWSVRKNLPGEVTVLSVKELPVFKVLDENSNCISLEIPKNR